MSVVGTPRCAGARECPGASPATVTVAAVMDDVGREVEGFCWERGGGQGLLVHVAKKLLFF